jgi:hypothetical protein
MIIKYLMTNHNQNENRKMYYSISGSINRGNISNKIAISRSLIEDISISISSIPTD